MADYFDDKCIVHVRGALYHRSTQGKIEGWHQIVKNRALLEHYYFPGDVDAQMGRQLSPNAVDWMAHDVEDWLKSRPDVSGRDGSKRVSHTAFGGSGASQ